MYVSKNIPKSDPNPGKYRDIFSTLFPPKISFTLLKWLPEILKTLLLIIVIICYSSQKKYLYVEKSLLFSFQPVLRIPSSPNPVVPKIYLIVSIKSAHPTLH